MSQHSNHFLIFSRYFVKYVFFVRHILLALLLLMVLDGFAIAHLEGLHLADSVYFTFITGLTIGYGDIEPVTGWGRVVSVMIGSVGLILTGMIIAVATRALADTETQIEAE